ncbi:DUF3857 domain-containing protein [Belliella sp. R4-6]|uniref:DUF3857 domain-containing protein n=1 Tax=Belliella alkalica TaxID=1730871 RepID=A0ABS9V8X1_9BACT|nr:DUF3857 domain-containing protein [Belliella alkalica]MCH7412560.1 DUF3857 domain-containing protein [Belliella alkalica]
MRKVIIVFVFLLFVAVSVSFGQDYSIVKIKPEWIKESSAVVRMSDESNIVDDQGRISRKVKVAYTILNSEANSLAEMEVGYSKGILFKNLSAIVYDASGKSIAKSKKSDIKDYSNFSSFSIYEDNRQKILDMKQYKFPYTVEFEYEVQYPNLYYISSWYPQPMPMVPVESATVTYLYPQDKKIRFFSKSANIDPDKKPKLENNLLKSEWALSDLGPIKAEPMMQQGENFIPILHAAPTYFSYDGFVGDLSSWESFGAWIYQLNKGKDVLSAATKAKVQELTADVDSDIEKTKVLYQYLQKQTRYVSIQLGIGGLMPFEASTVEKYSYGDCKALSNYMGALLKEAGIKSHYALIHGGARKKATYEEFPKHYFNHAILAVPIANDTIWLECTSQTNPFGYLSDFTSDRYALLISEEGGVLAKTPKYGVEENRQTIKAKVTLNENGSANLNLFMSNEGLQSENSNLLSIYNQSNEQKKKWFNENISLPSMEVSDLNFNYVDKGLYPQIDTEATVVSRNFANASGNRIFLEVNKLNAFSSGLRMSRTERKFDFERIMGFVDEDEFEYQIPEGYQIEGVPEKINLENQFGNYQVEFQNDGGKLIYNRKFVLNDGVFPANQYNDYVAFLDQVEKADKIRVVLVKK